MSAKPQSNHATIDAYLQILDTLELDEKFEHLTRTMRFDMDDKQVAALAKWITGQRKITCATYDRALALAQERGRYLSPFELVYEADGLALIKQLTAKRSKNGGKR